MSDKDKYYIDGYGTKRPKEISFWDSDKGQLVKKAGDNLITAGSFALGLLFPFEKLKIFSKLLSGAALTSLEGLLTAASIGGGIRQIPAVQKKSIKMAQNGFLQKDPIVVHRAIVLPKGKQKPDLQHKRIGENVYEIPETEKYVGSYDTAISSVNPKNLKRTVVEHYKLPSKKVRILEHDVYPDGQVDLVASIPNNIRPTKYSFVNQEHPYRISKETLNDIPMENWEITAQKIKNLGSIGTGLSAISTYMYLKNEKGSQ